MKLAQLTAGTLASIKLKARGATLPVGAFVIPVPVTLQLTNSESKRCWESVSDAADLKRSDVYSLKAQF